MTNVDGDPMLALSILNNKPVIDYDGNDRMYTSYDFRANNAADWRNGGYTAFGISRYSGGDSEPRDHFQWRELDIRTSRQSRQSISISMVG